MKAEIITIGDEILIGQIVDTNSQWMGQQLNKIGVAVHQITSIQDNRDQILATLHDAQHRADIIIMTGGLGPTKDDITKSTLCDFFEDQMILHTSVVNHIKKMFMKYHIPFGKLNEAQGLVPSKAEVLHNAYGTAPGMWFHERNTIFISLPGVPNEMKGLMLNEVIPRIKDKFQLPHIIHRTIMTYGMGESAIAERIANFESNLPEFIKLAYLPNYGRVRLRLTAKGNDRLALETALEREINALFTIIPDIITGFEEDGKMEEKIGSLLKSKSKSVSTAESLTGGQIAATLVSVPGASSYFKGGIIGYSAESKMTQLNVNKETIAKASVVSAAVAKEMAQGAKLKMNTDYAIAVTGNAGPTTDNTDKTVGVVFIAIATPSEVFVEEFNFGQPRARVIRKTVNKALEMLHQAILDEGLV